MKPRSERRGRLSRSADFERVYRKGRSVSNRDLVLYAFANPDAAAARVGLSVSRRVGGAADRNRVKRLLREAFRRVHDELDPGQDLVVVARAGALDLAEREGLAGIDGSLGELLTRADVRRAA